MEILIISVVLLWVVVVMLTLFVARDKTKGERGLMGPMGPMGPMGMRGKDGKDGFPMSKEEVKELILQVLKEQRVEVKNPNKQFNIDSLVKEIEISNIFFKSTFRSEPSPVKACYEDIVIPTEEDSISNKLCKLNHKIDKIDIRLNGYKYRDDVTFAHIMRSLSLITNALKQMSKPTIKSSKKKSNKKE